MVKKKKNIIWGKHATLREEEENQKVVFRILIKIFSNTGKSWSR